MAMDPETRKLVYGAVATLFAFGLETKIPSSLNWY